MPPERLSLPPDLAEDIGEWAWFFEALHALWLDSGEYEAFARTALEVFDAPVNQRGYAIAQKLNALISCYYFIFRDIDESSVAPSSCPKCHAELEPMLKWLSCPSCKIVI